MNGAVITGTPIAVDYWRCHKSPCSKVFFLSHAHSDHTSGLSSTWRYPIYCSEVTGKVVVAKCEVKQSLIKSLSVGSRHIIPLDESGKETMTVTLIDANHCPGSTMFLFEGYFGRFLYTGDFRYHPCMFPNTLLGLNRPVDRLYLDNTYNSPNNDFPGEDDCKVKIMEVLAEYPYTNVVLGMHQLGKEDLLVDIAEFYGEKIQVTPERMSVIELLDCKDVFTTCEERIRVVPVHTITTSRVEQWNNEFPTIVIIPSAIFRSQRKSCIANHPSVFIIPYSSHSSYNELIQFVRCVRPKKVIPIVQPPPSKASEAVIANMGNFNQYLDPNPPTPVSIPSSVQTYMNSHLSEVGRPILRKRRSETDKKCASKIAKGVVFEDTSDDESECKENTNGNGIHETNSDNDLVEIDFDEAPENNEDDTTKSIWDMKPNSKTAYGFEKLDRLKDKLSIQATEALQNKDEGSDQDIQDNEPKEPCRMLQVCTGTFYSKPKWIKQSSRKKTLHHVCKHSQSGKSCLCKYLVFKESKVHLTSKKSLDKSPSNSNSKCTTNRSICDPCKSARTNFGIVADEPCASTSAETVSLHEDKQAPSIMPVDRRSRKDVKCYSAIQNFYKRVKLGSITSR
nr:5' exonuclease Apollo-like [Lytechinus pictus]